MDRWDCVFCFGSRGRFGGDEAAGRVRIRTINARKKGGAIVNLDIHMKMKNGLNLKVRNLKN